MKNLLFKEKKNQTQLELGIGREKELDRNFAKGGRSFYFFDFDDNVAFLTTPVFLFHKNSGQELALSSGEFVAEWDRIGKEGRYKEFKVDNSVAGSFRNFRDQSFHFLEKYLLRRKQNFIKDLKSALKKPDIYWKGPSWACFYHAVFNHRPISVITARGHDPKTIVDGIRLFKKESHLPHEPNYLSLFPVSHHDTREMLGGDEETPIAELKKSAIRKSVEKAIEVYGYSPFHRFGMSDDDPKNITLISQEMSLLKQDYPEMSFFVIETHGGRYLKREVFTDHSEIRLIPSHQQMSLFDN